MAGVKSRNSIIECVSIKIKWFDLLNYRLKHPQHGIKDSSEPLNELNSWDSNGSRKISGRFLEVMSGWYNVSVVETFVNKIILKAMNCNELIFLIKGSSLSNKSFDMEFLLILYASKQMLLYDFSYL